MLICSDLLNVLCKVCCLKFHWVSLLFVETLVEKAQYEEAAEKSIQLETKVCRGYCHCFTLMIIIYNNTNRDHHLFGDSNTWHMHTVKWTGKKNNPRGYCVDLHNVLFVTTNFQNWMLKEILKAKLDFVGMNVQYLCSSHFLRTVPYLPIVNSLFSLFFSWNLKQQCDRNVKLNSPWLQQIMKPR